MAWLWPPLITLFSLVGTAYPEWALGECPAILYSQAAGEESVSGLSCPSLLWVGLAVSRCLAPHSVLSEFLAISSTLYLYIAAGVLTEDLRGQWVFQPSPGLAWDSMGWSGSTPEFMGTMLIALYPHKLYLPHFAVIHGWAS